LHCVRSAVRVAGRVLAFPPEKWKWKLCRCIRSLGFFVVRVGKMLARVGFEWKVFRVSIQPFSTLGTFFAPEID